MGFSKNELPAHQHEQQESYWRWKLEKFDGDEMRAMDADCSQFFSRKEVGGIEFESFSELAYLKAKGVISERGSLMLGEDGRVLYRSAMDKLEKWRAWRSKVEFSKSPETHERDQREKASRIIGGIGREVIAGRP